MGEWIEEQKKNRLFRGVGTSGDAHEMLKHNPTNRILNVNGAKKIVSARYLGIIMKVRCIGELCDMIEQAQMCVDAQTRRDFMKVAIEQWQGKLASAQKKFSIDNLV